MHKESDIFNQQKSDVFSKTLLTCPFKMTYRQQMFQKCIAFLVTISIFNQSRDEVIHKTTSNQK